MEASRQSAPEQTRPQPAIRLEGLNKRYDGAVAVNGVDLEIREAEFLTLLGPSGCGKTTSLRMIAGFVTPDAGRIVLHGVDITNVPPNRRNIGMVYQQYALFRHMSVFENVAFGLRVRRLPRAEIRRRVEAALELVRLSGFERRLPSTLSGGQQQRVALARALVIEPELLLLDEPLSSLDAKLRHDMQLELRRLQGGLGITTVYVTHDQSEALAMSDRIAVMNAGRIEQVDTPAGVYHRPETAFVAGFIGQANLLEGRVEGRQNGRVQVRLAGRWCLEAAEPYSYEPETLVLAVIRPEAVVLSPEPIDGAAKGEIRDVVYGGATLLYHVGVSADVLLLVESHNLPMKAPLVSGMGVWVVVPPEALILLPA